MVYVNDDGSITSNAAPRYRLVGYDIGTAPDANGGWVHWTDYARLEAEIARLTSEVTHLRADLANAGAVMVEALIERLHICDDEARAIADRISGPIGQPSRCPDAVQVLEDAETIIRAATRALSTLSPITAAARLLQVNTPNPAFDLLKPVLMGEVSEAVTYLDADGNEYSDRRMVSWDAMKDVLRLAFHALAEQEKADD